MGNNISTAFISCPVDPDKTLGIKLPFFVMVVKNMNKYFSFEVQIIDDKKIKRRFRASNYQSATRVKVRKIFTEKLSKFLFFFSHLFVQCQWEWMKDGIKFNLISVILWSVHMEQITSRLWEFKWEINCRQFNKIFKNLQKKN